MQGRNINFEKTVQNGIGGYKFNNLKLLYQAFIRKSYSKENGGEDNEVLEFIGDKVLDLAVVRYLSKRYGTDMHIQEKIPKQFRVKSEPKEFKSKLAEGDLTKLKQKLVQKKSLAKRIDELDFARFLITGKGDKRDGAAYSDSVKEDLFEAILGAVALDCDWDSNKLQDVVETMLCPDSLIKDEENEDYVSLIYEWCNQKYGINPYFKYFDTKDSKGLNGSKPINDISRIQPYGWEQKNVGLYARSPKDGMTSIIPEEMRIGPVGLGRQSFKESDTLQVIHGHLDGTYENMHYTRACQLEIKGFKAFEDYGETNNQARKRACKLAYTYLEENGLLFTIQDEIDNPNIDDAINQLETLARRGYFSLPEYEFEESHDADGNPIWRAECRIEEEEYIFYAEESSKKQAKKQAAYDMLMHVLGYEEE